MQCRIPGSKTTTYIYKIWVVLNSSMFTRIALQLISKYVTSLKIKDYKWVLVCLYSSKEHICLGLEKLCVKYILRYMYFYIIYIYK